jgi:hypothetical protein
MIQKLAADYAGQEDCLILVVLSMKGIPRNDSLIADDLENQAAAQIASQCDPDKTRTIGLSNIFSLTKVSSRKPIPWYPMKINVVG